MRRFFCCFCLLIPACVWGSLDWEADIKAAVEAHRRGELRRAEDILLEALLQAEQEGEDSPHLAYTLDYLGTLNLQMGEPSKAQPMLERSLSLFSRIRGASSPEALASASKLAESFELRKKYADSERLYARVALAERGDPVQQSADLNNWGISLDALGRQTEALELYKKALELRERKLGSQAPELVELLNNMARVYYMKGSYKTAESLYLRSISIDKQGDPEMLKDDYRRLAPLYRKMGRVQEAKDLEGKP